MFASASLRTTYKKARKSHHIDDDVILNQVQDDVSPTKRRSIAAQRLENLSTILHLALLRRDVKRAERAFAMLLRCERHAVSLRTLWELGLEILLRSTGADKQKAEEFIGRVRLAASDIGRHPTTEKQLIELFSALLVLHIRRGNFKEALTEVNKSIRLKLFSLTSSELLNWPYSGSEKLRYYASMLLTQFEALKKEQARDQMSDDNS